MSISLLHLIALLFFGLTIPFASLAERTIPESHEKIIAVWSTQDSTIPQAETLERAIEISQDLLERAKQPGRSYLYSLAHTTLSPWIQNNVNNALLWITWARIQQHKHDFSGALESLDQAVRLEPKNVNAHLIVARTYLIQQSYELAKKSCNRIVHSGDLLSASICSIEVASHQGSLTESYRNLEKIIRGLRENDEKNVWAKRILADMAARRGLWQLSEAWLDAIYTDDDLNTIIEWADVKLRLRKYSEVTAKLSTIVKRVPSSEDTILIRLALAEQHLNNDVALNWKQIVKERMALREQRNDLFHANDLAIFYLDIEPNPEKALQWAEINWQTAREYKDKALLERAVKMSAETNEQDQVLQ